MCWFGFGFPKIRCLISPIASETYNLSARICLASFFLLFWLDWQWQGITPPRLINGYALQHHQNRWRYTPCQETDDNTSVRVEPHILKSNKGSYILQRAYAVHRRLQRQSLGWFRHDSMITNGGHNLQIRRIVTNTGCFIYLVPEREALSDRLLPPEHSVTAAVVSCAMKVIICMSNMQLESADRNGGIFFLFGQESGHPPSQKICQLTKLPEQSFCRESKNFSGSQ